MQASIQEGAAGWAGTRFRKPGRPQGRGFDSSAFRHFFALLVQTSEHRTLNPEDPGSNPGWRTRSHSSSQVRTPGFHPGNGGSTPPWDTSQGAIAQTESTCLASRRLAVQVCLAPPDPPDRSGRTGTIFRVSTGVAVAKRLTRRDVTPVTMGLNPIGHPCGYSKTRIGSSVGRAFG